MNEVRCRFADVLYEVSHAHDQNLPRLERAGLAPVVELRAQDAATALAETGDGELERFTSLIEAATGLTQTVVAIGAGGRLAVRDRSDEP
jgi:hypothetical protein